MKHIVMLGPALTSRGGICSVIKTYIASGLFDICHIKYICTYTDGSSINKIRRFLYSIVSFLLLLLQRRVFLVHIHSASRISFARKAIFWFVSKVFCVPVIFHLHGGEFHKFYEEESSTLTRSIIRHILSKSQRVVTLSTQWKDYIKRIVPTATVCVIYNPVYIDNYNYDRSYEFGRKLLFMGHVSTNKGIFDLVLAIKAFKKRYPDICLFCAGDGELDRLKWTVQCHEVEDNVRILGWVEPEERRTLLAQVGIFVLPSYAEGLPMSLLEAMAAGMAVVTTPVGGIADAVENGISGLFVPVGDVHSLSAALGILLSDADLRVRLGQGALKRVIERFDSRIVVDRIVQTYIEVCQEGDKVCCVGAS